jgi:CHRD domain
MNPAARGWWLGRPARLNAGIRDLVEAGMKVTRYLALLAAALLMTAASAVAETVTLKGDLKGSNEVPPNNSTATGRAEASFDTVSRRLTWTISYSGTTGPLTGAHFHGPAEAGRNAGIVVPFQGTNASPITGSATLNEAQAADLLAGRWYANLHTAAHPGGELRGQMLR